MQIKYPIYFLFLGPLIYEISLALLLMKEKIAILIIIKLAKIQFRSLCAILFEKFLCTFFYHPIFA